MAISVRVTEDRVDQLLDSIQDLTRKRVAIGLVGGRRETNLTNMQLALTMEYGSPARNIPARPFLRPGVQDAAKAIAPLARVGALAAVDGHGRVVDSALNAIGEEAVRSIKRKIAMGPFVPLKPRTVRRKGHSQPLIDTHQMINSIVHQVYTR